MYILVAIVVVIAVLCILGGIYSVSRQKIDFYITGLDSKFSYSDLNLLWKLSQICELEQPTALFWSMPALTKCMAHITSMASKNGTDSDPKTQALITKLFDYRTKLQNETDEKKGLESTLYLDKGQRLRLILPGEGVFTSQILNNGKEIIISVPRKNNLIPITAEQWVGKVLSVYLWRKGDARYVFDTKVVNHGLFLGESSISIQHSNNLTRSQKRKAVRAKCNIPASLYVVTAASANNSSVETQEGYKCIIEDISESGALVHIAGKGQPNIQIKLQFNIQNKLVIMLGIIRTVEYNSEINESLLHFECLKIEPGMKNEVLGFVYNMLPSEEKEVLEAIKMTDEDKGDDPADIIDEDTLSIETPASASASGDEKKAETTKKAAEVKNENKSSAELDADELPVVIKGSNKGAADLDSMAPDSSNPVDEMHNVTFDQRTNLDDFNDNK